MKKWLVVLILALLAVAAYIAAGPFMTVRAIRTTIETQDSAALAKHVDFPALRSSVRAQFDDYLARQAGADLQSNPLGAIALRIASGVAGGGVDAMVTPAGIGAVLQGRGLWHRLSGAGMTAQDSYAHAAPPDPLKDARYRFESTSRFTATVPNADGDPVVFVLSRDGLQWTLSDIRLPLDAGAAPSAGRDDPTANPR